MQVQTRPVPAGQSDGLIDYYPFYYAAHINRAVEGYIYLRESRRFDASKLLVRTALEAVILLQAIRKKPELMFRIPFTDTQNEKKWVRPFNRPDIEDAILVIDRRWQKLRQAYQTKYPIHQPTEKELSLRCAAEFAGLDGFYDSHYRLYCLFTHAALRATTGDLNDFEAQDNRAMTICALAAVEALTSLGAPAPNLPELQRRLSLQMKAPRGIDAAG